MYEITLFLNKYYLQTQNREVKMKEHSASVK